MQFVEQPNRVGVNARVGEARSAASLVVPVLA
jgi:hypothetical protein